MDHPFRIFDFYFVEEIGGEVMDLSHHFPFQNTS
jgi:hypothetical protein